jgi:hypothetical protein
VSFHDGGPSVKVLSIQFKSVRRKKTCLRLQEVDRKDRPEQLKAISAQRCGLLNRVREGYPTISGPTQLAQRTFFFLRAWDRDRGQWSEKIGESTSIRLTTRLDQVTGLLSKDAETGIYRIIQEGLNNVIKHANATAAAVTITKSGTGLEIVVKTTAMGWK